MWSTAAATATSKNCGGADAISSLSVSRHSRLESAGSTGEKPSSVLPSKSDGVSCKRSKRCRDRSARARKRSATTSTPLLIPLAERQHLPGLPGWSTQMRPTATRMSTCPYSHNIVEGDFAVLRRIAIGEVRFPHRCKGGIRKQKRVCGVEAYKPTVYLSWAPKALRSQWRDLPPHKRRNRFRFGKG